MKLDLSTPERIAAADVVGSHAFDHTLWTRLDAIILDESAPLALRAAASRKVDEITGDEQGPYASDEERVADHVATLKEIMS